MSGTVIGIIIVVVVVLLIALWIAGTYNGLVRK